MVFDDIKAESVNEAIQRLTRIDCGELVEVDGVYVPAEES